MTDPTNTSRGNDLVPITDRMRLMQGFRFVIAAIAALIVWRLPGSSRPPIDGFAAGTAAFVLVGFSGRLAWRWSRRVGIAVFGLVLLLDGIYLAGLTYATGGSASPIPYLVVLHVISVALLASYRTGVKLALWHSLLLLVVYYLRQGGVLRPLESRDGALGTPFDQLVGFSIVLWVAALATAHFSATNERELRRRRYDIEALAAMAERLELTESSTEVAEVLLESAIETFDIDRGVVLAAPSGGDLRMLASHGAAPDAPTSLQPRPGSAVASVLEGRRTRLLGGLDPDSDELAAFLPGARSVVILPLTAEGHCTGVLVVERTLQGARIERRVVSMLERFSSYGSLALRNAWLLEEVQRLAATDALTGLANRATLHAGLEREMARAARHGTALSVLMLDIDHFKGVNDNFGHQAGDAVLLRVARRVKEVAGDASLVGRYGGEEFMVVIPDSSAATAWAAAERLRRAIADDDAHPRVTLSVGVAASPQDASDPEGLIRAADRALYRSKREGRNRATLASAG